jgi:hypothetical protein
MVGRGADGPPPMEVEAVMALRLSRLTGKTALGGIGVAGEFAGLDTPPRELGEAIIVVERMLR